jgi:hypothetical protein
VYRIGTRRIFLSRTGDIDFAVSSGLISGTVGAGFSAVPGAGESAFDAESSGLFASALDGINFAVSSGIISSTVGASFSALPGGVESFEVAVLDGAFDVTFFRAAASSLFCSSVMCHVTLCKSPTLMILSYQCREPRESRSDPSVIQK